MQVLTANSDSFSLIKSPVNGLFRENQQISYKRIDRMFAVLMVLQFLAGVAAAIWLSPQTWTGTESRIHPHVWAALFLGGIISLFPVALALTRPGEVFTRYAIAVGQMMMGALLIHITGGRIETHFHIFGSLAFLAFYRDWKVLVPATAVVLLDHMLRGMFFPQSIFGVLTPNNWRWLEHAGWIIFIDVFLVSSCLRGSKEMQQFAEKTIALENAEKERLLKFGEDRYRELFENANDLIFTHDLEGNFTSFNKAVEKTVGYLRKEAVGMNVKQIIAPDYVEFALRVMAKMIENQQPVSYEMVVITKEDANIWLEASARLVFEDEMPFGVQVIARDITARRKMEAALKLNEARMAEAQAMAHLGSWDFDIVNNKVVWSNELHRIFGLTPQEFDGTFEGFLGLVHHDDLERVKNTLELSISEKKYSDFDYRVFRPDGTIRAVHANGIIIEDENGTPVKMSGTLQDVTERVEAERALRESEARTRELIVNAKDTIYTMDLFGNFTLLNPAGEHLTGYTEAEALQMNITDVISPEAAKLLRRGMASIIKGAALPDFELELIVKSGNRVVVDVSSSSLIIKNGEPVGIQGIGRDITERKRAETERLITSKIVEGIGTTSNLNTMIKHIHGSIGKVIYAENCFVALYNKETEQFEIQFFVDKKNSAPPPFKLSKSQDSYVFRQGRSMLTNRQISRQLIEEGTIEMVGTPAASWLGVPLRTSSEVTGVLVVQHYDDEQAYNQRDLQFLTSIGDHIALAIERKRAEEALKVGEARQRQLAAQQSAILNALPAHICLLDPSGKILEVNNEWKQFAAGNDYTGVNFGVGSNYIETCDNAAGDCSTGAKQAADICRAVLAGESSGLEMEYPCNSPDEERWFKLAVTPLHKEKLAGAVVMHTNITERKRIAAELERARDAALESTRLKSEFLANMSHEIRTPMNGIIGMTELALNTDLDINQREYLEMVQQSGESLLIVINDILDFSKIEAQKIELESTAFDFNKVIGNCLKPLALRTAEKNLKLTARIAPDVPDALKGDPTRLTQILNNLVGNAIKFTETGEISVIVDNESETSDTVTLHFQVRDTGIGIPSEKHSTIFEAFTQADGTTTRKYGGTGLGLAITTQLVGLMGGSIWVESPAQTHSYRENPGSVFHFTIRLKPSSTERTKESSPDFDKPIERRAGRKTGLRVLLAEDNYINQRLAIKLLEKHRQTITLAVNGREAVAAARDKSFDVILMDVQMPVMNGFEATKAIIELEKSAGRAHTPIIAMTANAMKGDRERCLEAGMDDYIAKPIRAEELFQIIERLAGNFINEQINKTVDSTAGSSLDLSILLDATDGDRQLTLELIRIIIADSPAKMRQIQKSISENDGSALARAAHAFMSPVGYFPNSRAIVFLRELEDIGENDRWDEARATYENLNGEVKRINRFLEECINRKDFEL